MRKASLAVCVCLLIVVSSGIANASSPIVISQVYGGGGNAGATLKNDFVELFNRGATAVSVEGWSVQYASSAGSTWDKIALTGSIEPGQYYLVAAAAGATGTVNLPAAEASGTLNFSATTGKIALVSSGTLLSGTCPSEAVDLVGYGTASCAETATAPALSNTTGLVRAGNGCTDSDNNSADFSTAPPSPRNGSTPRNVCPAGAVSPTPTPAPTPSPTPVPAPPVSVPTIGTAPLLFPHFAQGGGYQTSFTFTNVSSTAATIALDLFSQNGTVIGTTAIPVAAQGTSRFAMTGATAAIGWARASFSPAVDLLGSEVIQRFSPAGVLLAESSMPSAPPDTILRLPAFERDGFGTGVAILNPGTASASVTLTLRSNAGTVAGASSLNLSASSQTARFVSELFPALGNFEGTLEISSSSGLAAFALRQNFLSGAFSAVAVSPSPSETYFSPRAGIARRIVDEINRTQTTLDIAIYSFTRDEIADAVIAANSRGVAVRIVADTSQSDGIGSDIARLEAAGVPLKKTIGGNGGIMHNKYAIFDGRIMVTGSYNWSTAAEENNDENAVFIRAGSTISAFQSAFNALWNSR